MAKIGIKKHSEFWNEATFLFLRVVDKITLIYYGFIILISQLAFTLKNRIIHFGNFFLKKYFCRYRHYKSQNKHRNWGDFLLSYQTFLRCMHSVQWSQWIVLICMSTKSAFLRLLSGKQDLELFGKNNFFLLNDFQSFYSMNSSK